MNLLTRKTLCLTLLLSSGCMVGFSNPINYATSDNGPRQIAHTLIPQNQNGAEEANRIFARNLVTHRRTSLNEAQIRLIIARGRNAMSQYLERVQQGQITFGQNLPDFTLVIGPRQLSFDLLGAITAVENTFRQQNTGNQQ